MTIPDYSELLQQIREAAGDPRGRLMQDELVNHIANLKSDSLFGKRIYGHGAALHEELARTPPASTGSTTERHESNKPDPESISPISGVTGTGSDSELLDWLCDCGSFKVSKKWAEPDGPYMVRIIVGDNRIGGAANLRDAIRAARASLPEQADKGVQS